MKLARKTHKRNEGMSMTAIKLVSTNGKASSSAVGRAILSDAVRTIDPARATLIEDTADWRNGYLDHFVAVTGLSALGAEATHTIAERGLESMYQQVNFVQPDEKVVPLAEIDWSQHTAPEIEVVKGAGTPAAELSVPFGGSWLAGQSLRDKLNDWLDRAIIEPGFAAAIELAIDHPEILRLPDHQAVLVGAGAEMGPYGPFSEWGADVVALDVAVPAVRDRLGQMAARGAGTTTLPAAGGMDIMAAPQTAAALIETNANSSKKLVLGMYGYADGAAHVTLTAAFDAIGNRINQSHDTTLAYLGTPTDSYLVPPAVVAGARSRWDQRGRLAGPVEDGLRLVTGNRLFRRSYPVGYAGLDGTEWGVADIMIPMQGPNYALAKRLQRWRAITAQNAGQGASFNVAPASWTRSVTSNKVFAVAYRGVSTFGVEVFAADTARYLMAAKLAVDLSFPESVSTEHPEALMYADANHGGMWSRPWDPKSVLPAATAVGLIRR